MTLIPRQQNQIDPLGECCFLTASINSILKRIPTSTLLPRRTIYAKETIKLKEN
jgi:hypothetical protein